MPLSQIQSVEEGVRRVAALVPELPVEQTLAVRSLILLGRELSARFDLGLRPTGLTEIESRALATIFSKGTEGAFPGDLCAVLAQSPANVTRVCDGLVGRGLITRQTSEEDRRRTLLRVTPEGESLVREMLPAVCSFSRDLFVGYTPGELDHLLGELRRIYAALDRLAPPTSMEQGS